MASNKEASPGVIVVAVVVLLLIIGGLYWKFLGPGSGPATGAGGPGGQYIEVPQPGGTMPGGGPSPGGAPPGGMPGPGTPIGPPGSGN